MFQRINIVKIFKRHFNTFYDYSELQFTGKHKTLFRDKLVFIVFPMALSLILVSLNIFFIEFYISVILTCLALFIGLLFNFLTLIYQIINKIKSDSLDSSDHKTEARFILSKELFVNVSFAIALSIFCVLAILITQFRPPLLIHLIRFKPYFYLIKMAYCYSTSFIAYFLIIEFVLTLLMILKRFFVIFEKEF